MLQTLMHKLKNLDARTSDTLTTTFQVVGDFIDVPYWLMFGPDLHFRHGIDLNNVRIRATTPAAKRWLYDTANELGQKEASLRWDQTGILCVHDGHRARHLAAEAAKTLRVKWNDQKWPPYGME